MEMPLVFERLTHCTMNLAFNPKNSNTFASSCLDHTVKVWSLGSHTANFNLDAHKKGSNYVQYYHGDSTNCQSSNKKKEKKISDLFAAGAEAIYLFFATSNFPSYNPKDPLLALRDVENAAMLGYYLAWFRIGRE
ncbi:hypothetical protein PtA15_6A357 [Puccinia triticina]|uniref:Uncharacterized protein n=1 Tax=Puccinia triticina TaxID=208348 RepID=A0ABY7CLC2_9BASI|nr:uncharacterized protein PtA15_6A357 [Puccinia triticina]WAQ85728.1 hypothetical protein PtA15_6A357 [Puccinia triticina]WAR55603.1 hypothetical protein PtB15_6B346 [Puccinia triticina]